jgi:hypothetical protein
MYYIMEEEALHVNNIFYHAILQKFLYKGTTVHLNCKSEEPNAKRNRTFLFKSSKHLFRVTNMQTRAKYRCLIETSTPTPFEHGRLIHRCTF